MTADQMIRLARRRCEVNAPAHVGRPLNLRPRSQRGWRNAWKWWVRG